MEATGPNADSPVRMFAIDWSGAVRGARKKIWLAEVVDGRLVCLKNGRSRNQVADYLEAEAERDPNMVVGFDFAFSLPAWFLEERCLQNARELWDLADLEAEDWLAGCEPPFWGRKGKKRPVFGSECDHYRITERKVQYETCFGPKSVFQINGAGAVGTGSLRGTPVLRRLSKSKAGFSVWPFDAVKLPLVVEIYPRILTGAVNKSSIYERTKHLATYGDALCDEMRERAASNEDAFDAAVSALVMSRHLEDFVDLTVSADHRTRLEGEIWHPSRLR